MLKEISFSDIDGLFTGNAHNDEAKTGCSVFYFSHPAAGAVDISGGGPASCETPVIDPERADTPVNALVLGGGSAYGLAARDGVMQTLEKNGIGFDTNFALVPIVVQSDIYDLNIGSPHIRPDAKMGSQACSAALFQAGVLSASDLEESKKSAPENTVISGAVSGNTGGGSGASVGKICGMARAQKTGIGYAAFQCGNLKIGAVVVLNAFGDIYFEGKKIAGLHNEDGTGFTDMVQELYRLYEQRNGGTENQFTGRTNTTIGAIFTNGNFTKAQLKKIASMTRAAYDRGIRPVGTMADGDTIYAFSVGPDSDRVSSDINVAGTLAAQTMEYAIKNAVDSVEEGTAC